MCSLLVIGASEGFRGQSDSVGPISVAVLRWKLDGSLVVWGSKYLFGC